MGYGHNTLLYPCVEMPWWSIVQLIFVNTKVKTEKKNMEELSVNRHLGLPHPRDEVWIFVCFYH